MATAPVRPDNSIPIIEGQTYKIGNSEMGGQWVVVVKVVEGKVHAVGIESNIADLWIPLWKFDDIVATPTDMSIAYYLFVEEETQLTFEDGSEIIINVEAG